MPDNKPDTLAGWICEKVSSWESWRDENYDERWSEYYRLWRGIWTEQDKNRNSERSRIICPELSQAIETSVAELEDATFIRDRWVDVSDDALDKDKKDIEAAVTLMMEDFNEYSVPDQISESYLNGAIYGTGIAKIVVEEIKYKAIDEEGIPGVVEKKKICVRPIPINPRNFVIDPGAKNVDEALGCAHVFELPLSEVQKRISDGKYNKIDLAAFTAYNTSEDNSAIGELNPISANQQSCKIIEWHGLVPKSMISGSGDKLLSDDLQEAIESLDTTIKAVGASEELVEALVTIVNEDLVARAVMNPFIMGDRSIIAFQYDTVPNRFWGRGVAEKGYNPQKALDAEIRARIDALALSTHPMMGIDATKIPRGETFSIRPGRSILTTGNPGETLLPIKFPPPDPHTFQQTQELREMIQRGTGSYELPANAESSRMAATSMSMVVGSMIKRSRRTLSNIERQFLKPMVQKTLWRYMQFDPKRFPMKDYKFTVRASMGIMAREFEQGQLVSLLSTVPAESPAFWMLIKGIYTNSNIEDREAMIAFADSMLEKAMNPQPPPPDPKVLLEAERLKFDQAAHRDNMDLETLKQMQIDKAYQAEGQRDIGEGKMQEATAVLQRVKAETEQLRAASESALNMAKAESERMKIMLEAQKIELESQKLQMETVKSTVETIASLRETERDEEDRAVDKKKKQMELESKVNPEEPNPVLTELIELVKSQSKRLEGMEAVSVANKAVESKPKEEQETTKLLKQLMKRMDSMSQPKEDGPARVERDPETKRIVSVNGRPVTRDENGLMSGVE